MCEVELDDGERVQAYKHHDPRWYLHLDHGGRAYVYREDGRYQEVEPRWLLEIVLAGRWGRANIVQQNVLAEFKRIRWARSATKHRVSRKRARCHCATATDSTTRRPDDGKDEEEASRAEVRYRDHP